MFHTDRVIVVEGKYDKIRLSALTDAAILTTEGFGVFSDREKQCLIRALARRKGLLILTDSDAAGFRIRRFLTDIAAGADIVNAYIPDVYGTERRKSAPGKEGKLGVEGMDTERLTEALRRCEALTEGPETRTAPVTAADLFEAGLTGRPDAAEKRRAFMAELGLPARLNGAGLLRMLNALMTREEFLRMVFPVDAAR